MNYRYIFLYDAHWTSVVVLANVSHAHTKNSMEAENKNFNLHQLYIA